MASRISFGGYTFLFQVLTTSNAYTAEFSEPVQEGERLIFRAQEVSYGDDSGRVPALFEVSFSGSPQAVSWQARAEHSEPVKGIKAFVESLPFGKVVTPPGLRWEISESAGQCFVFPHGAYPVRGRRRRNWHRLSGRPHSWYGRAVHFDRRRRRDRLYTHK